MQTEAFSKEVSSTASRGRMSEYSGEGDVVVGQADACRRGRCVHGQIKLGICI